MDRLVHMDRDLFLLTDGSGDIAAGREHGLFARDTRHLSRWTLQVGARPFSHPDVHCSADPSPHPGPQPGPQAPALLGAALSGPTGARIWLQFPSAGADPTATGSAGTLGLLRRQLLQAGIFHEQLRLTAYRAPIRCELALAFAADYADLFEVRGMSRSGRGRMLPALERTDGLTLGYRGLDGLERVTHLCFDPPPTRTGDGVAVWAIALAPGESLAIHATVSVGAQPAPASEAAFSEAMHALHERYTGWEERCTRIRTDNPSLNQTLAQSLEDLCTLTTDIGHGPLPVAGIPWFAVPFGRDSILTALQCLPLNPALAAGTLQSLAGLQGKSVRPDRAEAPGKILHELRHSEMANLGEVPFGQYYGSVDATPLFVILAHEYYRWTGGLALIRRLLPALQRAIGWLQEYADPGGDGFVTFTPGASGLLVQSWKDSHDSMTHRTGEAAAGAHAVCEVQGYAYRARLAMASLLRALGSENREQAVQLERAAAAQKVRFNQHFWMSPENYVALALDGARRQVAVISSDPGHCLWTGILEADKARAVAYRLLAPDLFSGWGIRTLATTEPAYSPFSYHNGSVWPHDNSLIALGLARCGYQQEAARVAEAIFGAAAHFPRHRLPELFCGYGADEGAPVPYPVSCSPQAWAAGAPFALLQALLGLEPDAAQGRLRLAPSLPAWLGRVELQGLQVGGARINLTVEGGQAQSVVVAGRLSVEPFGT